MKNTFNLFLLLLSFAVFSQQKTIEITNIKTGKIKVYEENQRIKIRTLDGKKHIGNLHFSDNQTLLINNQSIKIDSLQSIKKQPKGLGTLKTIVLATGLSVIGASLISASTGNNSSFLLLTIGSGVTISSGILEGIYANNSNRKWSFKIIEK
jgi:hypothetical protein